jgi:hypothetical protein
MSTDGGYSACVNLRLTIGGRQLALSHVGPGEIIVRDDCQALAPCDAQIEVTVDGRVSRKQVFLPFGIPGPSQRIAYF